MEVTKFELFPTLILQIDVSDVITSEDRDLLVSSIDNLIELSDGPVDKEANPAIQSKTFLFDEGAPQEFIKLKKSFVACCNHYLETVGEKHIKYFSSRAWFFKTWESLNQKNDYHNHVGAVLSGVFYLKGTDHKQASGTVFHNPNPTHMSSNIASLTPIIGSWIIFPSNIYHKNDKITTEIPRYIIAADYFGFKD